MEGTPGKGLPAKALASPGPGVAIAGEGDRLPALIVIARRFDPRDKVEDDIGPGTLPELGLELDVIPGVMVKVLLVPLELENDDKDDLADTIDPDPGEGCPMTRDEVEERYSIGLDPDPLEPFESVDKAEARG